MGVEVAAALHRLYPEKYEIDHAARFLGSKDTIARIRASQDPALIAESWAAAQEAWRNLRANYLLYR